MLFKSQKSQIRHFWGFFRWTRLGLTEHSEKNQLYITTMYYQHYFENSFKIYECDEADNALFEAISHYTDESASQLKAIVTDGMKSNEERIEQPGVALDKSIISKLSMRLQRPIIVISQDHRGEIFLCFGKELFNDPNNIRDGHPIFVLYNSSQKYHGLQVRGEEYFEIHLSKKLNNSVSCTNNDLREEYLKAKEAMKKFGLLSSAPHKKSKEKTSDLLSQGFFGERLTTQESSKSAQARNNYVSQPSKKNIATASEFDFENNRFTNELRLSCQNVLGDGFCFFRAVAKQIIDRKLNVHRPVSEQLPTTFEEVLERVQDYFNEHSESLMEKVLITPKREDFMVAQKGEELFQEALKEYNNSESRDQRLQKFKKSFFEYVISGKYDTPDPFFNAADWMPQIISEIFEIDIDIYDAHQSGTVVRSAHGYSQRIGLGRINKNHYISLSGDLDEAYLAEEQIKAQTSRIVVSCY